MDNNNLGKKKMKRLATEIPIEMHNQLKYIGIKRNCPMRKIIIRALLAFIKHEEKFN